MKFLIRCWLIVAMVLAPAIAYAGGCRAVRVVHAPVYHAPVVVEKVIEKVVNVVNVARFFDVPLYNVFYNQYAPAIVPYGSYGYGAAPLAPRGSTCEEKLSVLEQRLQRLEGLPEKQRGPMPGADNGAGQGAKQPPTDAAGDLLALFTQGGCASCHDKSNYQAKKAKTPLTDGGKLASLSPELLGEIIDRVTTEDPNRVMPPPEHPVKLSPVARLKLVSKLVQKP